MRWVNGITKNEHSRLHRKLVRKNGKALKCEGKDCTHKNPKRFDWALKKGHTYSFNAEDYLQLCVSCHRKYDFTEAIRQKLKDKKVGEKNNKSKLTTKNVLAIYRLLSQNVQNDIIAKKYKVDPSTISDIKRGKRWPHLFSNLPTPPTKKQ